MGVEYVVLAAVNIYVMYCHTLLVKMQVQFKFLVITDKVQEKKTSDFLTLYYHLSYITSDTY